MVTRVPVIVSVLGADRVGKSTIVKEVCTELQSKNVSFQVLHFSGPKPQHNSPIDQYILPLEEAIKSSPHAIICDRGFSEVCFYEKYRRHMEISEEWALSAESYFSSRAAFTQVFFVRREWSWCKPHHIKEIKQQYPDCTEFFIHSQLQAREKEHHAYYEYMEKYMSNISLLPHLGFGTQELSNTISRSMINRIMDRLR